MFLKNTRKHFLSTKQKITFRRGHSNRLKNDCPEKQDQKHFEQIVTDWIELMGGQT